MGAEILSPVTLPCSGRTMANRLAKVALYEHLAKMYGGPPNKYHIALYAEWAKHGWGMIVTGNVQVSREHLTLGRDMVVPEVLNEETSAPFKRLARAIHGEGSREPLTRSLAVMQLSHVGRQSPNVIGGRKLGVPPMAPSPIRLGSNKRVRSRDGATSLHAQGTPHPYFRALFQQPREMTLDDIEQVQQAFIRGALTALEAGFDGVQLHCAHGYLLAQFLNPKSNVRQDEYSIESPNALRMVREIVVGIRAIVPKDFVIGVKINSADYVETGERPSSERVSTETQRVLDHIRTIALWGMVDFIEISGGDYESPDFMATKAASPRQAFFAQFAKRARECLKTDFPANVNVPLILLTGGLRSPSHLQSALDAGHADLLGIGRGSILRPDLPTIFQERILNAAASGTSIALDDEPFAYEPDNDIKLPSWVPQIPLVGAGVGIAWYNVRMRWIARSQLEKKIDGTSFPVPLPAFGMSGIEAMVRMWVWLEWHESFIVVLLVSCVATLACLQL
ncbi:FMN-linked oxidoreductase [Imleria badia]|nr:FMN-linked oxidoreductase [Imleria badia]